MLVFFVKRNILFISSELKVEQEFSKVSVSEHFIARYEYHIMHFAHPGINFGMLRKKGKTYFSLQLNGP